MPRNYKKSLDTRYQKGWIQRGVKTLKQAFALRHLPILDGLEKNFNWLKKLRCRLGPIQRETSNQKLKNKAKALERK